MIMELHIKALEWLKGSLISGKHADLSDLSEESQLKIAILLSIDDLDHKEKGLVKSFRSAKDFGEWILAGVSTFGLDAAEKPMRHLARLQYLERLTEDVNHTKAYDDWRKVGATGISKSDHYYHNSEVAARWRPQNKITTVFKRHQLPILSTLGTLTRAPFSPGGLSAIGCLSATILSGGSPAVIAGTTLGVTSIITFLAKVLAAGTHSQHLAVFGSYPEMFFFKQYLASDARLEKATRAAFEWIQQKTDREIQSEKATPEERISLKKQQEDLQLEAVHLKKDIKSILDLSDMAERLLQQEELRVLKEKLATNEAQYSQAQKKLDIRDPFTLSDMQHHVRRFVNKTEHQDVQVHELRELAQSLVERKQITAHLDKTVLKKEDATSETPRVRRSL